MPVSVVKRGSRWVTVGRFGKVHGKSTTREKALASARAINAAYRKKSR